MPKFHEKKILEQLSAVTLLSRYYLTICTIFENSSNQQITCEDLIFSFFSHSFFLKAPDFFETPDYDFWDLLSKSSICRGIFRTATMMTSFIKVAVRKIPLHILLLLFNQAKKLKIEKYFKNYKMKSKASKAISFRLVPT